MSEYNVGIHQYDSEQCRQILSQLPGVFAARVRFEDDQPTEIHVLASSERNPKQIVRDVQSVLFATYGAEIDHRIISIAQLPDDPFAQPSGSAPEADAPCKDVRLFFSGIDSSHKDGVYQVNVHLACDGQCVTGNSHCRDTLTQRTRAVASATLEAVNQLLGRDYFSLLDVKQVNVWDVSVIVTVMEYQAAENASPSILVGAAAQQDNASNGVVRSTLDGLNRCIGRIYSAAQTTK